MDEVEKLKKRVGDLEYLVGKYEENGPAKLFYSLNRKAWEMADMLNSINLKSISIEDPKDKSFERIRFIINDSSSVASAVKALGDTAGITYDEDKDVKAARRRTTPESIADDLGDNKRQDV